MSLRVALCGQRSSVLAGSPLGWVRGDIMSEVRAQGSRTLTRESFERLLAWLAPDREEAGRTYEEIRRKLIKIFTCRGCREAEELADETIDRVCNKLPEVVATYVGNPALYFYGIARNLMHEYARKKPDPPPPPPLSAGEDEEEEREYSCLEECLRQLTAESRDLVLGYYQEEKQAKIDQRKSLAERLGIEPNALRIRAYRIRQTLQQCVTECMAQASAC